MIISQHSRLRDDCIRKRDKRPPHTSSDVGNVRFDELLMEESQNGIRSDNQLTNCPGCGDLGQKPLCVGELRRLNLIEVFIGVI